MANLINFTPQDMENITQFVRVTKDLHETKLTKSITALDVARPAMTRELVFDNITSPTINFRNRQSSVLGKIMGRSATLIVFATAGLLSLAEGIASLALAIITSPTLLLSKESQLAKYLFIRSASAAFAGIAVFAASFFQLGQSEINGFELPEFNEIKEKITIASQSI
ncbi:MAG: hypothetical protein WDZ27_05385 [Waddliaceae bacterium]